LSDSFEPGLEITVIAGRGLMFGCKGNLAGDGFLTAALVLRDVLIVIMNGLAFHKATLRWGAINPRLTWPALSTITVGW
jgi:hypothetical protein